MERTYIWAKESPVRKDRALRERTEDDNREFLSLPKGLPDEVYSDVLDAVKRAYETGREDRGSELLSHGDPDVLRTLVAAEALGAIREWAPGWTKPVGGVQQYRINVEGASEHYGTLTVGIGTDRYEMLKHYRVRVLVEEVTE